MFPISDTVNNKLLQLFRLKYQPNLNAFVENMCHSHKLQFTGYRGQTRRRYELIIQNYRVWTLVVIPIGNVLGLVINPGLFI